jgi:hypothetical protein
LQIKHLLEHLTGLLAAALAILFPIGMVYCIVDDRLWLYALSDNPNGVSRDNMVYLDSFTRYARIQLIRKIPFVIIGKLAANHPQTSQRRGADGRSAG